MAGVISDNGLTVTYQNDDGTTTEILKDSFDRVGGQMPDFGEPDSPMAGGIPAIPPPPPEPPAPEFAAPDAVSSAAQFPPPVPPQAALLEESRPELLTAAQPPPEPQPTAPPTGMTAELATASPANRILAGQGLQARGFQGRRQGAAAGLDSAQAAIEAGNELAAEQTRVEQLAQEREEAEVARRADIRRKHGNEIRADLDELNKPVEQNRVWHDLGTGGKIAAIAFAFMNGIGNTQRGSRGQNQVIDQIRATIDRDIKLQLAQKDSMRANIAQKRTLMGDALASSADQSAAIERARAAGLRIAKNQYTAAMGKAKNAAAKAAYADLIGQIDIAEGAQVEKAATVAEQREDQIAARRAAAARAAQARQDRIRAEANRRADAMEQREHELEMTKLKAAAKAQGQGARVVSSPTRTGQVHGVLPSDMSDPEVSKFKATQRDLALAATRLKEFKALARKHGNAYDGPGGSWLQSGEARQVRAARNRYLNAKVKAFSGATVSEEERKRFDEDFPLDSFMNRDVQGVWDDELADVAEQGRQAYNAANVRGVAGGPAPSDVFFNDLMREGRDATGSTAANINDVMIQATTDASVDARLDAIRGLTAHVDSNETAVNKQGVQASARAAAAFVLNSPSANARQKNEARRALQTFEGTFSNQANRQRQGQQNRELLQEAGDLVKKARGF